MPYTGSHILFTATGALPGGEVWSCGLRTISGSAVGVDQATLEVYALAAANGWVTYLNSEPGYATGTNCTSVTARLITFAGLTEAQGSAAPTVAPGSGNPAKMPNQNAVVVSLITGRAGRTGKGRVYVPLLAAGLQGDGRRSEADSQATAAGFAAFLTQLNVEIAGSLLDMGVQSQKASPSGSKVTSVRVGRVIDTQRRRRDSLVEAYTTAAVS